MYAPAYVGKYRNSRPTFTMTIPSNAIGLIIGKKGENIKRLKQIDGVHEVFVDQRTCEIRAWCAEESVDALKSRIRSSASPSRIQVAKLESSFFLLELDSQYSHIRFRPHSNLVLRRSDSDNFHRIPLFLHGMNEGEVPEEPVDLLASRVEQISLLRGGYVFYPQGSRTPGVKEAIVDAILDMSTESCALDLQFAVGQTCFLVEPQKMPLMDSPVSRSSMQCLSQMPPLFCDKLPLGVPTQAETSVVNSDVGSFCFVKDEEKSTVHLQKDDQSFSIDVSSNFQPGGAMSVLRVATNKTKLLNLQLLDDVNVYGGRFLVKSHSPAPALDDELQERLEAAWAAKHETEGVLSLRDAGMFVDCERRVTRRVLSDGELEVRFSQVNERLGSKVQQHGEIEITAPRWTAQLQRVLELRDRGSEEAANEADAAARSVLELLQKIRTVVAAMTAHR